ncbi:MAG: MarC family protein [Spirochaetales bacterium]|nr:MarC family protein [Spirochaetales bacterium]
MIETFFLAFIPIFVAIDAVGVLPLFLSFTEGYTRKERVRIILQSIITALIIAVAFLFLGDLIFRFLGISVGDFMVAGGAVLFCIAIIEIVNPRKRQRMPGKDFGAVPLGTPLIAGPAVLTTSLILATQHGVIVTLVSLAVNIAITGGIFFLSDFLIRIIGDTGAKAMSKVTSLLLAAIAVMMVRKGIFIFIGTTP